MIHIYTKIFVEAYFPQKLKEINSDHTKNWFENSYVTGRVKLITSKIVCFLMFIWITNSNQMMKWMKRSTKTRITHWLTFMCSLCVRNSELHMYVFLRLFGYLRSGNISVTNKSSLWTATYEQYRQLLTSIFFHFSTFMIFNIFFIFKLSNVFLYEKQYEFLKIKY